MIDDPSLVLQFIGNYLVAIATKFLLQDHFYQSYYHDIFKELPIGVDGMGAGLDTSFTT